MAMYAVVVKGGKFTFTISQELARGLRITERNPRNEEFLVTCDGAVGQDKTLIMLEELTRLDTSVITDSFPFPQIFVFTNVIIVCGHTKIYELVAGALVLKYTAPAAGGAWSAVDFYDYVYLSNGAVAVIRDAGSYTYAADATQPHASAICNFNGQVLVGAPSVDGLGASLMLPIVAPAVTLSILGTMTTV